MTQASRGAFMVLMTNEQGYYITDRRNTLRNPSCTLWPLKIVVAECFWIRTWDASQTTKAPCSAMVSVSSSQPKSQIPGTAQQGKARQTGKPLNVNLAVSSFYVSWGVVVWLSWCVTCMGSVLHQIFFYLYNVGFYRNLWAKEDHLRETSYLKAHS